MKIQNRVRGLSADAVEGAADERWWEQSPVGAPAHGKRAPHGHRELPELRALRELQPVGGGGDGADSVMHSR